MLNCEALVILVRYLHINLLILSYPYEILKLLQIIFILFSAKIIYNFFWNFCYFILQCHLVSNWFLWTNIKIIRRFYVLSIILLLFMHHRNVVPEFLYYMKVWNAVIELGLNVFCRFVNLKIGILYIWHSCH